ncbi:GPW/gp25 family protein [Virgibacillus sediminis]|uniref:GPW/gp25 family protein n=1 Tax=Virgibacillus sediminis TaxID=202260 RepID=A0ABV7A612_9BACI
MKTIKLDDNRDLAFEKGDFVMIDEEEEVLQSIYILLETNKKEWFFDPDMGLRRRSVTGKPTDGEVRAAVTETISQEERVDIEEIKINQDRKARRLTVFFRARIRRSGSVVQGEVEMNA